MNQTLRKNTRGVQRMREGSDTFLDRVHTKGVMQ